MTHLTLFNPSVRRFFADPFSDLLAPFGGGGERGGSPWSPPVDVRHSDSEVVIEAELPGIPRENISVRFHDGRLILEGRREEVVDTKPESGKSEASDGWTHRERVSGRFQRAFELPDSVDASRIRAESKDGVLTIVLPKLEKARPRQIEVSVH